MFGTGTLSGGTTTIATSSLPLEQTLFKRVRCDPASPDGKSKQVKQVVNQTIFILNMLQVPEIQRVTPNRVPLQPNIRVPHPLFGERHVPMTVPTEVVITTHPGRGSFSKRILQALYNFRQRQLLKRIKVRATEPFREFEHARVREHGSTSRQRCVELLVRSNFSNCVRLQFLDQARSHTLLTGYFRGHQ